MASKVCLIVLCVWSAIMASPTLYTIIASQRTFTQNPTAGQSMVNTATVTASAVISFCVWIIPAIVLSVCALTLKQKPAPTVQTIYVNQHGAPLYPAQPPRDQTSVAPDSAVPPLPLGDASHVNPTPAPPHTPR